MKILPMVTLICADSVNHGAAIYALKKTLEHITPAKTIFFTDRELKLPNIEVRYHKINSRKEYSEFILKTLYAHIETEYVLIVQSDGYVIDGEQWDDEYLQYDLLGAPWPYDHDRRIGNGGCSLRSLKLLKAVAEDDMIDVLHPEDQSICIIYKMYLEEKYGIKFAPETLAAKFSYELIEPTQKTFAFHGWHWPPFQETVVIKRTGAMGDVIQVQPILEYFHKKGYRVVLDTLPEFFELFRNHYFPIHFKPAFNPNIPYKEYNLDMSYETDPKKLHLQAYYDFCGIPKEEQIIKNPKLAYVADGPHKLFKKYAVIHIDEREQASRNVYGIDWGTVAANLFLKGYTVIQIGKNKHDEIRGAIYMSTITQDLLAYLICGCDLMIGCDSGPMNIAVATGRKCIVFHGSVNPDFIYPDQTNMIVITNHNKENPICNDEYCWHSVIGCTGKECYVDKKNPPCTLFQTEAVINAINKIL